MLYLIQSIVVIVLKGRMSFYEIYDIKKLKQYKGHVLQQIGSLPCIVINNSVSLFFAISCSNYNKELFDRSKNQSIFTVEQYNKALNKVYPNL